MTTKREIERPIMRTYSNLTKAIKDGEPIDWVAFGDSDHRVKMVSKHGKLKDRITRDPYTEAYTQWGWDLADDDSSFQIFSYAWEGERGWTLWVEGEIPLIAGSVPDPVTADTLPVGACFMDSDGIPGMVFEDRNSYLKVAFPHEGTIRPAGEIKVQQVFGVGTFKPDGEADV